MLKDASGFLEMKHPDWSHVANAVWSLRAETNLMSQGSMWGGIHPISRPYTESAPYRGMKQLIEV